jgi:hypothetical protein
VFLLKPKREKAEVQVLYGMRYLVLPLVFITIIVVHIQHIYSVTFANILIAGQVSSPSINAPDLYLG